MYSGKRILFVSRHCGFNSGLERYLYFTTALLRSEGAQVWLCYFERNHDAKAFESIFDRSIQGPELPDEKFDLAALHAVTSNDYLAKFLGKYGKNSALFIHNYEYFCPSQGKLLPGIHTPCKRKYNTFICGCCSLLRLVKGYKSFDGVLGRNFILFKDRLDYVRRFPRIVVTTKYMRDSLLKQRFSPNNMHVIPPAIPIPYRIEPKKQRDIPGILYIGPLSREKGVRLLIDVLARLKQPFHAKIVGEGPMLKKIIKAVRKYGIEDKVEFLPWATSPELYFEDTDIFVSPSIWEDPSNMGVAEASAWGLPVVAFNTGEVKNLIIDGKTGFAIPPRDINAMAQCLDRLLADFSLRQTIGENARQNITETYPESRFLRGFERLLD